MELIIKENVELIFEKKKNLVEILKVGSKIHLVVDCCDIRCWFKDFLIKLERLIESIKNENLNEDQKLTFHNLCSLYQEAFLATDQIIKKFNFDDLSIETIKLAFFLKLKKLIV